MKDKSKLYLLKIIKEKNILNYYINKLKDKNLAFNYEKVVEFSKDFHRRESLESIKKANLLLKNIFLFNDPWDMEQCAIPYKLEPITWEYSPNGDEEWVFMLNRQEYLHYLIEAYYLSNDKKYIEKWIELVIHWIENNPMDKKSKAWRTIDTGIRCMSITLGLNHIIPTEILKEEEFLKILNSLFQQANYIKDNYIYKDLLSNWGVLQSTGVCAVLMNFYDIAYDKELLEWAIDNLEKQLNIQVFEDGTQWEQSPMYLVEVLYSTLKVIYISEKQGIDLPYSIKEKAYKMSKYLIYSAKPDHHQVMQSDSDDTDIRDICTLAAIIFKDSNLKWIGYDKVDFNTLWLLGDTTIDKYNLIKKSKPNEKSKAFEDSGNYYLRDSWSEKGNFSYFHNGTLGSGHGHGDLLHFNITAFGEDFLIDPGRYTYVEGDSLREYLKSPKAHNTFIIDNEEFTKCKGSWSYEKVANPMKNYHKFTENVDYIEGSYIVKDEKENISLVTRKFIYIKPSLWVICDLAYKPSEHICRKYFHFDKEVSVTLKENKTIACKNNVFMKIYHENINELKVKRDIISKNYNKLENSKTVVSKIAFKDVMASLDIIHGDLKDKELKIKKANLYQAGSSKPINENVATSFEIEISNKERYIIILVHEEIFKGKKIMLYNNEISVYGKTVVIHEKAGKINYISLKN